MKKPQFGAYKSFVFLLSFIFLLFITSCKKDQIKPVEQQKENISKQELKAWISSYEKLFSAGLKPLLDKAVKTYYNGQMIVKVPLSSGGGDLYPNYSLPNGPTDPWVLLSGNNGYYDPNNPPSYTPPNYIDPNLPQIPIQNGFINELGYYTPYSQELIDNYFQGIEKYWLSSSYDSNNFPPYDPNVDGDRDGDGYRKNGPQYQYVGGTVQN